MDAKPIQLQKYGEKVVQKAAKVLQEYEHKFSITQTKDLMDVATTADLAAEKIIISLIKKKFPRHVIVSEEAGVVEGDSQYSWFVDPLDGTKEYVRGSTEYNTQVAVEKGGRLIACAIKRNGLNQLYSASWRSGAWLNGMRIFVSQVDKIAKASIGYHLPVSASGAENIAQSLQEVKNIITHAYRIRAGWDESKLFGYVADGILDAHIVPGYLKNAWHDLAPGILLVEEAGGKVTDCKGNKIVNHDFSSGVLASNGKIHDQLLRLLA